MLQARKNLCRGLIWAAAALTPAVVIPVSAQTQSGFIPNPAVVPTDRLHEDWWAKRHQETLDAVKQHPDTQLLMIGDSITHNYVKTKLPDEDFRPTWDIFYEPRQALNLGFSGDTTANVLWRLSHGEIDGLHPKVAVVLIGTNNTGHAKQTAEQTEAGIDAVVAELEQRLPQTHVLLLGITPSDISQEKTTADLAVNRYLATCYGENQRARYLDISSIFYRDGILNTAVFYDPRLPQHAKPLHPDTTGQKMMAEAIEPALAQLMGDTPRIPLASMTDINTALIPAPWLEQDSYDWYARHHAVLEAQKSLKPRVVMIGDSITHFWGGIPNGIDVNGPASWQKLSAAVDGPLLNMGFGWDRTQNVLWRMRQGEFAGLAPEWVVLMIGTNNLTGTANARANTPEEIVGGIEEICAEVHKSAPQSRIVVMGILPRGLIPDGPLRKPILRTNALLAKRFGANPSIIYADIGTKFLSPDGSLPKTLIPDGTHPSDAGYDLWADALIRIFETRPRP